MQGYDDWQIEKKNNSFSVWYQWTMERINSMNNLGVTVDERMNFVEHIDTMESLHEKWIL
jgi:hypothetical protein